jgi:hypothetical protein
VDIRISRCSSSIGIIRRHQQMNIGRLILFLLKFEWEMLVSRVAKGLVLGRIDGER